MDIIRLIKIHVKDVKGIRDTSISCDFFPNTPNFLVAPNGSGKTSLATAFASLNQKRLKLQDKDLPRDSNDASSLLEIQFADEDSLAANAERNEIGKAVDTFVINSGLYAKASPRYFGNVKTAQASLLVPSVVLRKTIPTKTPIEYSVSEVKKLFPNSLRRFICNLRTLGVFDNVGFLRSVDAGIRCHSRIKRDEDAVIRFVRWAEKSVNSGEDLSSPEVSAEALMMKEPILEIAEVIDSYISFDNTVALYLNAIQVFDLYERQKDAICQRICWLEFEELRRDVNELLACIDTSGTQPKAVIRKGSLVVEFPDRSRVSNGELDVLRFAAALFEARESLKKDRSILLIDEVFDYLDEANLLLAQHFLLRMMQDYRDSNRLLFTIILTHLDPSLMASYRFKTKHVSYFPAMANGTLCDWMRALLLDRDRCSREHKDIYEDISKRYLHYSEDVIRNEAVEQYLADKGAPKKCRSVIGFSGKCQEELDGYARREPYDAALVCCGIRITVEKLAYVQLRHDDHRKEFMAKNGTVNKLDYAVLQGAHVPESHYLLGAVYNSCMHLKGHDGELGTLLRMLNNEVVRHMVKDSLSLQ